MHKIFFMRRIIFTLIILISSGYLFAQSGSVRGNVVDAANNDALIGATIFVEGNSSLGTTSDIDGNYTVQNLPVGIYNIVFQYVSYKSKIVSGVEVKANAATELNVSLETNANELEEVVVRTDRTKENINSLMVAQKNSTVVSDGISSDIIKKTPDRNTSDALRRVSGVTIQNNKFAIIRGLSDRYNNALLNGTPMPSTEVDRKAFSFDLIPTALVDNIIVIKTAEPDLPGDFAGGIIRVNTRDIPDENFLSLSGSLGYNSITTFKQWYTSQSGKTDWLGYDDGTRALPSAFPQTEALQQSSELALQSTSQLPNTWGYFSKEHAPMNYSFQISGGLKKKLFNHDLGVLVALSYAADYRFSEVTRADYNFDTSAVYRYYDDVYKYNVLLGGLVNFSYKINDNNKITWKNSYSTNTDDITTLRNGSYYERTYYVKNFAYYYSENHFFNTQLLGSHYIKPGKMKLEWNAGYARTSRSEPDYRKLFYNRNFDSADSIYYAYVPFGSASPDLAGRFYSQLDENIYNVGIDLSVPFHFLKNTSNLKLGTYQQYRDRSFNARVLGYVINNAVLFYENPDPNAILGLAPDQIFSSANIGASGFRIDEITNPSDAYTANSDLHAYYGMLDNKLPANFRLIWGARIEIYNQHLLSALPNNAPVEVNAVAKDSIYKLPFDLLPSANLVYSLSDKTNIRLSASQTVSRPEFRELAPFSFYDFNTSTSVTGNPGLKRTLILNLDARVEKFWGKGQVISASLFYKKFNNPIEQIIDMGSGAGSRIRTYENVTIAKNYGVEFEVRKNFDFLEKIISWNQLENISFTTNLSYIKSIVDFSGVVNAAESSRPLQGQSPYIINAGLQYNEPNSDFNVAVFYNVIGRRIDAVGDASYLDIYEAPRPVLDAQLSKRVLKNGNLKLSFADILSKNSIFYQDQDADGKFNKGIDTQIVSVNTGSRFTLSFSYKFD